MYYVRYVRACVRACVGACVRACVRAWVFTSDTLCSVVDGLSQDPAGRCTMTVFVVPWRWFHLGRKSECLALCRLSTRYQVTPRTVMSIEPVLIRSLINQTHYISSWYVVLFFCPPHCNHPPLGDGWLGAVTAVIKIEPRPCTIGAGILHKITRS